MPFPPFFRRKRGGHREGQILSSDSENRDSFSYNSIYNIAQFAFKGTKDFADG
jgi:hypothetical protein